MHCALVCREVLCSAEFRGAFGRVVFAVLKRVVFGENDQTGKIGNIYGDFSDASVVSVKALQVLGAEYLSAELFL